MDHEGLPCWIRYYDVGVGKSVTRHCSADVERTIVHLDRHAQVEIDIGRCTSEYRI
jgi:hypothetical protein